MSLCSVIDYWSAVKTDGEGYSLVFFFVLTPEALADWERPEPTMPAIALLRRFVLADMDGMGGQLVLASWFAHSLT